MKILDFDLKQEKLWEEKSVVALGKFESLHLGHQEVLSTAYRIAKKENKKLVFMVFDDFNGFKDELKKQIIPLHLRLELLKQYEPDAVFLFQANTKNFSTTIQQFVDYLKNSFNADEVVFGKNFKIKGANDHTLLLENFKTHVIDLYKVNNQTISTTSLKTLLDLAELDVIKQFLGFDYFYEGVIERGYARGKDLGFPTANVQVDQNLYTPKQGIYYSYIQIDNERYASITSISNNPTFGNTEISYETFIFDFDKDLYGKKVYVQLLQFVREPIKFENKEQLIEQIKLDVSKAQDFFKNLIK